LCEVISEARSTVSPQRARLLLVDDQESVRETTAALLADEFEVVCAPDGTRALELLTDQSFEIVCADYNMPGMTGAELLRRAQAMRPCAAVLVTGHSEYVEAIAPQVRQAFSVVLKPYEPQMLIDTAHRAYMLLKASSLTKQRTVA
jgi:DNA-binding NtrC family response regulator